MPDNLSIRDLLLIPGFGSRAAGALGKLEAVRITGCQAFITLITASW